MKVSIKDQQALSAVSPAALSAYARAAGWSKTGSYGDHSDVYDHEEKPEIILPRTQRLGDYASVVAQLIEIFADDSGMDDIALYRNLVTADKDVIRVRVESQDDGTVNVKHGLDLVGGAYDMLLATTCSLNDPKPFYRAGANKEANDYLGRVRLGQTEQGSFVVTLLPPAVPPPMQQSIDPDLAPDDPFERKVTKRLVGALVATKKAAEETVVGDERAFYDAVTLGASANLCDALVKLIGSFMELDVGLVWARTRPMKRVQDTVGFSGSDAPILREAARVLRDHEPKYDFSSLGFVRTLTRDEHQTKGTITLQGLIVEGKPQSATAVLNRSDYDVAIKAHQDKTPVIVKGDLERKGQRWHLSNPSLNEYDPDQDAPDGE